LVASYAKLTGVHRYNVMPGTWFIGRWKNRALPCLPLASARSAECQGGDRHPGAVGGNAANPVIPR
jgi:hypothetical protein